jgi:arylsulfatase A-like enzyme
MNDKPRWMRSLPLRSAGAVEILYDNRIAALRAVDDLIGRVSAALEAAGALEETAFLFTSDNGYLLGLHRWRSKILLYEESIRVPLLVRLPGAGAPRLLSAFVLNNDLAPTIAALAEVTPGLAVDGRSLVPLLRGETDGSWRKRFLVEYPPAGERFGIPPFFAVREGSLLYGETLNFPGTRTTDVEHYDLSTDPFQTRSLHNDFSLRRVLERSVLRNRLQALKACGAGTCQLLEQ